MSTLKGIVLKTNDFKNNQIIVKSNYLIEASYWLTLQEQRIILLVASMIKAEDEDFKTYRFKVQDFMKLIEVKGHSKYKEMKQITKKLRERTLTIKNIDEDTEAQVGWVSSFKYFNKEGYVQVRLDPELKPYFLNLKERFTQYQLHNVIKLKSGYSIRLYELLKQYQKIGERYFDLSELKRKLGIEKTGYPLYANFKQKILNRAEKELPDKTDLKFTFKEKKKGRKVIGIHFLIKSKRDAKPLPEIINLELYERLQNYFCLSPAQARDVLSKYKESRLLENLAYVERKYKEGGIQNIGPYTLKAIRENYKDQPSLFDEEKIQKKQEEAQKRREEQLKDDYKIYKDGEIKKYRKTISDEEMQKIKDAARKQVEQRMGKNKIGIKTFINNEVEKCLAGKADLIPRDKWMEQNQ